MAKREYKYIVDNIYNEVFTRSLRFSNIRRAINFMKSLVKNSYESESATMKVLIDKKNIKNISYEVTFSYNPYEKHDKKLLVDLLNKYKF